jgi:hypothetical protein
MGKLLADFLRAFALHWRPARDARPHHRRTRGARRCGELILGAIERHQFLSARLCTSLRRDAQVKVGARAHFFDFSLGRPSSHIGSSGSGNRHSSAISRISRRRSGGHRRPGHRPAVHPADEVATGRRRGGRERRRALVGHRGRWMYQSIGPSLPRSGATSAKDALGCSSAMARRRSAARSSTDDDTLARLMDVAANHAFRALCAPPAPPPAPAPEPREAERPWPDGLDEVEAV